VTDGCVFCSIVAGDAPAEIVGENERALAFMDVNPIVDGHTLVIPKSHAQDIWTISQDDGEAVWALARELSARIRDALGADGLTLFQANGRAGWQHVFHFHLHLVPRWRGDGLVRPWDPSGVKRSGIADAADRIRAAGA
jgi:histidine triad (HIT) family protein